MHRLRGLCACMSEEGDSYGKRVEYKRELRGWKTILFLFDKPGYPESGRIASGSEKVDTPGKTRVLY